MEQRIITKTATVMHFRPSLGIWYLLFDDGVPAMSFCSTCFHSSRPVRFPRTGEKVEVLIDEDTKKLLLVREIKPPPKK